MSLTLSHPVMFKDYMPKEPDHMLLCTSITMASKVVELFKGSKDVVTLLVCTGEKIWLGVADFL